MLRDMTRLLHTADLHLADGRPERWEALEAIRELAEEREVDAAIVAGDLLDRAGDHAALRARVRERLAAFPCDVFVLPGNHDREAYRAGQDWGPRTHLMLGEPVHEDRTGGVRLLGVPFPAEPSTFARIRRHVADAASGSAAPGAGSGGDRPVVLALHGTLVDAADPHIQAEALEDEPEDPYFPVRTGELQGLGLAYVALGHYHQPDLRRVGPLPVAYAGAPSPIGSHAWGPRSAMIFEVDGGDGGGARGDSGDGTGAGGGDSDDGTGAGGVHVEAVRLPVPYRERLVRWLTPFEEAEDLERLEAELDERADPHCSLRVELDGILAGMDEAELSDRLEALQARREDRFAELELRSAGVGLDPGRADLFRDFLRRLEEREEAASRPELRQRTLEIAARALKA